MAITYPITLPNTPGFRSVSFRGVSFTSLVASPYTGQPTVYRYPRQLWRPDVELPPMTRDQAEAWIGALLSLEGQYGTFRLGDPVGRTPRGVATGTPVVDGNNQTGQTLATRGWTPSVTGILKAGDWIQLGDYLHKVMIDADSDASGLATLEIWPALRVSPLDSDAVITSNTQGLFRLAGQQTAWDIREARLFGLRFSAVEAL